MLQLFHGNEVNLLFGTESQRRSTNLFNQYQSKCKMETVHLFWKHWKMMKPIPSRAFILFEYMLLCVKRGKWIIWKKFKSKKIDPFLTILLILCWLLRVVILYFRNRAGIFQCLCFRCFFLGYLNAKRSYW